MGIWRRIWKRIWAYLGVSGFSGAESIWECRVPWAYLERILNVSGCILFAVVVCAHLERVGALFELIWNLLGPSWGSFGGGGSWGPLGAFWGLFRGLLGSPGGPLGAVVEGVGDRKI
eukprot:4376957-Pyramimonas_sp.AAC.1